MVADVVMSFDTVDRSILGCALRRLGWLPWFRKVYLVFHNQVRLRFKLAAGLGEPLDGGIPQGCPLSMVFIVALCVSWCRLESMPSIQPQLTADNLKCSSVCPNASLSAARFTVQYVRSVGQNVFSRNCVLLNTSKAVRQSMKPRDVSGDGQPWKVELDIRDLGGHLDFTRQPGLEGQVLRLVRCLWGSRLSWDWLWVSICQRGCMRLVCLCFFP